MNSSTATDETIKEFVSFEESVDVVKEKEYTDFSFWHNCLSPMGHIEDETFIDYDNAYNKPLEKPLKVCHETLNLSAATMPDIHAFGKPLENGDQKSTLSAANATDVKEAEITQLKVRIELLEKVVLKEQNFEKSQSRRPAPIVLFDPLNRPPTPIPREEKSISASTVKLNSYHTIPLKPLHQPIPLIQTNYTYNLDNSVAINNQVISNTLINITNQSNCVAANQTRQSENLLAKTNFSSFPTLNHNSVTQHSISSAANINLPASFPNPQIHSLPAKNEIKVVTSPVQNHPAPNYSAKINKNEIQIVSSPIPAPPSTATLINDEISVKKSETKKSDQKIDNYRTQVQSYIEKQINSVKESPKVATSTKKSKLFTQIFRYFNLFRAIVTFGYAIFTLNQQLNDRFLINEFGDGIKGLTIAQMFFVCVDLVISFVSCFPMSLWFLWDVKNWDPFSRSWSIWSLIADHELILDVGPALMNLVLQIYSYRLAELVLDPAAKSAIDGIEIANIRDLMNPKHHNFVLLVLFGITMSYTVLFHTARICWLLFKEKKAVFLSVFVLLKGLLLLFDILTNSFFIYETLVSKGLGLLIFDTRIKLLLAVVIPSPICTLMTNVLVNFPLHFYYIKMKLDLGSTEKQPAGVSLFKAATTKTFHPLITSIFGTFSLFSIAAAFNILYCIRNYEPYSGQERESTFFEFTKNGPSGELFADALIGMIWLNLLLNYAIGVLCCCVYWALTIVRGFLGGSAGIAKIKKILSLN